MKRLWTSQIALLLLAPQCQAAGQLAKQDMPGWAWCLAIAFGIGIVFFIANIHRSLNACPFCNRGCIPLQDALEKEQRQITDLVAGLADREIADKDLRFCRHCRILLCDHAQHDAYGDMLYKCLACNGTMAGPEENFWSPAQRRLNDVAIWQSGEEDRSRGLLICAKCGALHGWKHHEKSDFDYLVQLGDSPEEE